MVPCFFKLILKCLKINNLYYILDENGFLQDRNNFSLLGNTDGVAIFKYVQFNNIL